MKVTDDELYRMESEAEEAGVLMEFLRLQAAGQSPRFALMLAMRQFPGVNGTDAKFNRLERDRMSAMDSEDLSKIVQIARKAGINTTGKTYNGALGRYNDPAAWVSGTHDVRVSAKAKGLSLRGQVNVENQPVRPPEKKLSRRLVKEYEQAYCSRDPALAERVSKSSKAKAELRERIVEKHAIKRPPKRK